MVPWQTQKEWQQVELFFTHSVNNTSFYGQAGRHAKEITHKIELADILLESLCKKTCNLCTDPCCVKATVWYDFRDLLYLFLSTQTLPAQQLIRKKGQCCPKLGPNGCTLKRHQRPFICTWYLCPDQKRPGNAGKTMQDDLADLLSELKNERKRMEREFLSNVIPRRSIRKGI